jgi:hypothetical protein
MVMPASRLAPGPPAGVAGFPWNQWQLSPGFGGSFAMESVATFVWNGWQVWRGISGRFGVEYAPCRHSRRRRVLEGHCAYMLYEPAPRVRCAGFAYRAQVSELY